MSRKRTLHPVSARQKNTAPVSEGLAGDCQEDPVPHGCNHPELHVGSDRARKAPPILGNRARMSSLQDQNSQPEAGPCPAVRPISHALIQGRDRPHIPHRCPTRWSGKYRSGYRNFF